MTGDAYAIVYLAQGEVYLREALASARSAAAVNPRALIEIYASGELGGIETPRDISIIPFDAAPGFAGKVDLLSRVKHTRFAFLDTDTFCLRSLEDVFNRISQYSVRAVPDPLYNSLRHVELTIPAGWNIDSDTDEYNTGVIFFNKERLPENFFNTWLRKHSELTIENPLWPPSRIPDQLSFIETIFALNSDVAPLPSEYNYRACYPGTLRVAPFVVHSRTPDAAAFGRRARNIADVTLTLPSGPFVKRRGTIGRASFQIMRLLQRLGPNRNAN